MYIEEYFNHNKYRMSNTEQYPQEAPRTTSLPEPSEGNNRGTGPRTPGHQR